MGIFWIFAAILGLLFPPLAVVAMAMMIVGAFAKGVIAGPQEEIFAAGRKSRRCHRADDAVRRDVMASKRRDIIDAHWYPLPPLLRLPTPMPEGPHGPH
jgi:hypothetical protein